MNLYYIAAYRHEQNEWWRFAVSAETGSEAVEKFKDGYDDIHFSHVDATFICTTPDDVFQEL